MPWMIISGDAAQALGDGLPALDHGFEERVGLGPAAVQRQRFDALRIFAGKPQPGRRAERQAAHMRALDADRLHEGGDVVGEQFRRIGARRACRFRRRRADRR